MMNELAFAARVLLAIVFGAAAGAKLLDLQSSRDTLQAFGLPHGPARLLGTLLPVAETACAVALLVEQSGRWGAVGALVLLVVFSAGIAFALSRGRTPNCNCFGQVSSEAIGWHTLTRNGALAAVAAFAVAAGPGSSLGGWTRDLTAANVTAGVACVCAALAGLAVVNLRLRNRELMAQLAEAATGGKPRALQPGMPAPDFTLPDLTGKQRTLQELCELRRSLVLVFASPACGPCRLLLPQLSNWSRALSESLTIAIVESGVPGPEALAEHLDLPGEMVVLAEDGFAVPASYNVSKTPTAFLIGRGGVIGVAATTGGNAIEQLVRSALRQNPTPELAHS